MTTFTHGALFEGYGGTSMAAAAALNVELDTRWYSEIKPAAIALLEKRQAGVPNLGDITTVDWANVETVDVLTGSWPCQPHSSAGKRLGMDDPRALWPQVVRAIDFTRPAIFMGENVARITTNGELRRVVTSLAEIGYVGAWRCITAASVGAPHKRDRCFLVAINAYAEGDRWPEGWTWATGLERGSDAALRGDGPAPDSERIGVRDESGRGGGPDGASAGIADDDGAEGSFRSEPHAAGIARRLTDAHRRAVSGADEGNADSLFPTPTARDAGRGSGWGDQPGRPLSETIHRLLPTPTQSMTTGAGDSGRDGGLNLQTAAALLPTPIAGDAKSARNGTQNDGAGSKRGNPGTTLSDVVYTGTWGPYADAIARWEHVLGRPAPEPTQPSSRKPYGPQLSPRFVEWMMGVPEGWVTDAGNLTPRGLAPAERNAQLSLLGDGVCPPQGEAAFRDLLAHVRTLARA